MFGLASRCRAGHALPSAVDVRRTGAVDGRVSALQVVHGVDDRAVDPHLEVQVRAVAAARAARVADDLALADARAHRGAEARLVRVARRHRRRVLDAGVVAVAARGRLALHQDDPARGGGADRRARRDADVDAGVAGLPGARFAERRGDRAVDGPDQTARALPDRAGWARGGRARGARGGGLQARGDALLLALQRGDVVFEVVALVARRGQGARLLVACALGALLPRHELGL